MEDGDGTVRLGTLNMRPELDRAFNLEPDVFVSSPVTRQKAAAAKQIIENHYKNYLQGLQDRKERFLFILNFKNCNACVAFFFFFFLSILISFFLDLGGGPCREGQRRPRFRQKNKKKC